MRIGFIGLGNLGTPIAENLLEKKHALHVYNRTAAKAQPLANKGAVVCTSVKEVANLCDIVFSIVADDAALNHIVQGDEGIAANLKAGGIHICMSTILPATATHLSSLHQQYNNHYTAAPVMGRPDAARARKLNFLVSGNASIIEIVKPFLQDAGATGIWEFGDNEAAGNILLKEAYQPANFSLRLGLKDVNLVMEQAAETNAPMMFGKALQERLQQCVANGLGEYDWTAIALALKEKSVV